MKGVKLPYNEQGYIFFMCRNFRALEKKKQERILAKIAETAPNMRDELFDVLCSNKTITQIAYERYCDATALYRLRKKFYESF